MLGGLSFIDNLEAEFDEAYFEYIKKIQKLNEKCQFLVEQEENLSRPQSCLRLFEKLLDEHEKKVEIDILSGSTGRKTFKEMYENMSVKCKDIDDTLDGIESNLKPYGYKPFDEYKCIQDDDEKAFQDEIVESVQNNSVCFDSDGSDFSEGSLRLDSLGLSSHSLAILKSRETLTSVSSKTLDLDLELTTNIDQRHTQIEVSNSMYNDIDDYLKDLISLSTLNGILCGVNFPLTTEFLPGDVFSGIVTKTGHEGNYLFLNLSKNY
ncbi:hypothetical protein O9G_003980 [Rozella allomycis CSF55]|uniref:Uncharacterized protein n=1 Tax=Rozella allomycis (strain CSF55) TaxID=988480 RepID=A0A075AYT0_ROZAC|nr:hypothetical protein O9G_003980 [Rozella allomycis CSF55]|eukprot:EPZ33872.1 hypothetical protein O9G_003980 [Rozella allomycis CSF55]